jgi:hypothetical protein
MLTNSYNNDKYGANTTSIFVPVQYKPQIEAVIEYQNTQQSADNGEFICAIECSFGFGDDDNDMLLVTVQESSYKRIAKQLFDTDTLLDLLLDTSNPVEDDDVYIKSACEKQELGNIWFNRDWLLPVPIEVHWAAASITDDYELNLHHITPVADGVTYRAWYTDDSYPADSDEYWITRCFVYADGAVTDNTLDD